MTADTLSRWFASLIDPEARADTPPPRTLGRFLGWMLSGAWPAIFAAAVASALAGAFEVVTALILGDVIDAALGSDPASFFSDNVWLLVGVVAFLLILRPLSFGASAAFQALALGPNINNLVLSRLHRYTMGQSVTFFDNDFAGRIAQKQM